MRARLITNPRSGRGHVDLSPVMRVLQTHGWDVDVRQKLHGGHATELAEQAALDGFDVVINCGGDGTMREIVNGLVRTDVAVGAIPGGTVNLWARELGISTRPDVAALQMVGSVRRHVDVGHVTVDGRHGRHFLLMAGLGFDGAAIARVSKPLKRRLGPLAVGLAIFQALPSFRPVPVRVEMDGVRWQGRIAQIVVGNTRRYGGFTRMTPDALIDDGMLDVCLITATNPLAAGRQVGAFLLKQRPDVHTSEVYRAARVVVFTPDPVPLQLDGGSIGALERRAAGGVTYTFSIRAQALSVLVPRAHDRSLFAEGSAGLSAAYEAASRHEVPKAGIEQARKPNRRLFQVIRVGVDSIAACRLSDGHVWSILFDSGTVAEDVRGQPCLTSEFLANLHEGSIIRVRGNKDHDTQTVHARRISACQAAEGRSQ